MIKNVILSLPTEEFTWNKTPAPNALPQQTRADQPFSRHLRYLQLVLSAGSDHTRSFCGFERMVFPERAPFYRCRNCWICYWNLLHPAELFIFFQYMLVYEVARDPANADLIRQVYHQAQEILNRMGTTAQ